MISDAQRVPTGTRRTRLPVVPVGTTAGPFVRAHAHSGRDHTAFSVLVRGLTYPELDTLGGTVTFAQCTTPLIPMAGRFGIRRLGLTMILEVRGYLRLSHDCGGSEAR